MSDRSHRFRPAGALLVCTALGCSAAAFTLFKWVAQDAEARTRSRLEAEVAAVRRGPDGRQERYDWAQHERRVSVPEEGTVAPPAATPRTRPVAISPKPPESAIPAPAPAGPDGTRAPADFNRLAPAPVLLDVRPPEDEEPAPALEIGTAAAPAAPGSPAASTAPAPTLIGLVPLGGTPGPSTEGPRKPQEPAPVGGEVRPPARPPEPPTSVPRVTLVPVSTAASPGQTVRVEVRIDGAQDVASVPFHVQHDDKVLQFQSVQVGEFLGRDGAAPVVMAAPVDGRGEVAVGITKVGSRSGISGSGTLLTIDFRVVGAGTTPLVFAQQRLLNSRRREMPAQFISSQLATQ